MCKVSTLRNVEPPSPKFFCKADQLPKIYNSHLYKQPLVLIEEDSAPCFSLPQLKESHLPEPLPTQGKSYHASEESVSLKNVPGQPKEAIKSRRCGTPFVSSNLSHRSQTPNKIEIEKNAGSAVPLPNEKKNLLNRSKLHPSLSCSDINGKYARQVNTLNRIPTPPTSPPKCRPPTPFLVTRTRSVDRKKLQLNLRALDEGENVSFESKSREFSCMKFNDKESFLGRKIDRDKTEDPSEEEIQDEKYVVDDQNIGNRCKIRMDKTAFQQWIKEHRLP